MRKRELIEFRDQCQAARKAVKELRIQRSQKIADRIANTVISYHRDTVLALTSQRLQDMLEVYRAAGAPNLTGVKKSNRVGVIRQALSDAIQMYEIGEWVPIDNSDWTDAEDSEEGEDFDFGDIDNGFDESD